MSTTEIVEHLKRMSNPERLAVIEAASQLVREDLAAEPTNAGDEDPILRVAGCLSGAPLSAAQIEKELYGEEQP